MFAMTSFAFKLWIAGKNSELPNSVLVRKCLMKSLRLSPATKRKAFFSIEILSLFVEAPREKKGSMAEVNLIDSIGFFFGCERGRKY